MSMTAALKAARAASMARTVLAIELLCGAQAVDLLAPLTTSPPLARVHARLRERVPSLDEDRPPAPDISVIDDMIAAGDVESASGIPVT